MLRTTRDFNSIQQLVNGGAAAVSTYAILSKSSSKEAVVPVAFGAGILVSCVGDQDLARAGLVGLIAGFSTKQLQEQNGSW